MRSIAGVMLSAMIGLALLHGLAGTPLWLAGVAAWVAGLLLLPQVSRGQKAQMAVLLLVGALCLGIAVWMDVRPDWIRILDTNAMLLSMIASIGFLRIIARGVVSMSDDAQKNLTGPGAYLRTLLGLSFFGAFINISALILITDRLAQYGPIKRFTSQSVTRVFSGCSAWSPFFGGMAVVLTLVPDLPLATVMLWCLPFAIAGFIVVMMEARIRYGDAVRKFLGYPITAGSLWLPAVLAICVGIGSVWFPDVSILTVISASALLVCAVASVWQHGAGAVRVLSDHVRDGLPGMASELLLFLFAGVLAVGLTSLISAGGITLGSGEFGAYAAWLLLLIIVGASMIGIHPVVTIAATVPLVLTMQPPPLLLATTLLFGWSLGTCASPLSGTHIIFQARYGVPSLKAAIWNWPFTSVMFVLACGQLYLVSVLG